MNPSKRTVIILVVLLIIALGSAGYFFMKFRELSKNPNKVAQEEVIALVETLSKIIVLPEGEQPTVATVTDPDKLKDQPFFSKAKVGDKVIIYTNARKAILYDPVAGKIVEVAPVNIGTPTTESAASAKKAAAEKDSEL